MDLYLWFLYLCVVYLWFDQLQMEIFENNKTKLSVLDLCYRLFLPVSVAKESDTIIYLVFVLN